jgi:ribosome biogenesis protein YTM1
MPEKEKVEKVDQEIQIRLKTELTEYSVEDTPFSVPLSVDPKGLNSLVKSLLPSVTEVPEFDWLCLNDLVRGKLSDHLAHRDDVSTESVLVIEYVEKCSTPKPDNVANHDDWVSSCRLNGDLVLTGCYDNTVNIWSVQGEKKLVIPGHEGPVKAVDWIECTDRGGIFVSASHDQNLNIYTWNREQNSIENINTCKGHERSVECVSVSPSRKHFISGSFDGMVKIWSAKPSTKSYGEDGMGASVAKKARADSDSEKRVTRTPLRTLGGHKEAVSGVTWLNNNSDLVSVSWDHTIKIWELEMGGLKTELVANKALFSVAVGGERGEQILVSGAERSIRLYDPKAGNDVKAAFIAHTGWVTAVSWAPDSPNRFVSASHDTSLRVWDVRSSATPLYEMTGHSDKVLACHWQGQHIVSGGADNQLKFYNMSNPDK